MQSNQSEAGSHRFSRVCFQGYSSSAGETLETTAETTQQYFAFSYYFVYSEVIVVKVGHYSAFAFAAVSQSVFDTPLIPMFMPHS